MKDEYTSELITNAESPTAILKIQGADPNTRAKDYFSGASPDFGYNKETYRTTVSLCRNIYKDEPIIHHFVKTHLGLCSYGMENEFKGTVKQDYKTIFNSFAARVNENIISKERGLDRFQQLFCYQYFTAGMIATVERVASMKMTTGGGRYKPYKVPVEITFLDPLRVNLDNLYTENQVYYDLSDDTIKDVTANGEKAGFLSIYDDGSSKPPKPTPNDPNPIRIYKKKDIVQLVKVDKKTSVPLPANRVRLRRVSYDDSTNYPTPPIAATLVPLGDKAMLREADRSIMAKVINMILTYTVSRINNGGQKIEVQTQDITAATNSFLANFRQSKDGRVFILFKPDTHELAWLSPDMGEVLNLEKYRTANLEILFTLYGFAAPMIMAEGQTGSTDMLLKMVEMQHSLFLNCYTRFIEEIYSDIVNWNNLRFDPTDVNLRAKRLSILDTKEFMALRSNLADKNQISIDTLLKDAGTDLDTELPKLEREKEIRDADGLLIATPTFSQTTFKQNQTTNPADTTTSTDNTTPIDNNTNTNNATQVKEVKSPKSSGRPAGVVENKPRNTK